MLYKSWDCGVESVQFDPEELEYYSKKLSLSLSLFIYTISWVWNWWPVIQWSGSNIISSILITRNVHFDSLSNRPMSDDCDSKTINSFMTFGCITKGMTQCLFEYSVCYAILSVSLFQTRWHHQLGDLIFLFTLQSIRYASSTRIEQLESYSYTVYLPKGLYTIVIGGAKKNGLCCCWWPASTDRISRGTYWRRTGDTGGLSLLFYIVHTPRV